MIVKAWREENNMLLDKVPSSEYTVGSDSKVEFSIRKKSLDISKISVLWLHDLTRKQ